MRNVAGRLINPNSGLISQEHMGAGEHIYTCRQDKLLICLTCMEKRHKGAFSTQRDQI